MTDTELKVILDGHKKWLNEEDGGERADLNYAHLNGAKLNYAHLNGAKLNYANLNGAKLNYAHLNGAVLNYADLTDADLTDANLTGADLTGADLTDADLTDANLTGADLTGANLSQSNGIPSAINFISDNFEKTEDGIIAYKVFGGAYESPESWKIEPGAILTENVNFNRTYCCGCGINCGTKKYVTAEYGNKCIYKLLIRWEWLPGVVVPYGSEGQIRCERAQIIGEVTI